MPSPKKKPAAKAAPAAKFEEFDWHERIRGQEWLATKPEKDTCPPRIRCSSKNTDGTYIYFCYRNGEYIGFGKSLEDAQRFCEKGEKDKSRDVTIAKIKHYVDKTPGEIPPWLLFTQEERNAVRAVTPWAAPSATKVRLSLERPRDPGVKEDPGTKRLREELAKEAAVRAGKEVAARPKRTDLQGTLADGKLVRLRDENPKAPGSAAHKRWEALFAACAKGLTVRQFEEAGGNPETLRNAIAKGYVRAQEEK